MTIRQLKVSTSLVLAAGLAVGAIATGGAGVAGAARGHAAASPTVSLRKTSLGNILVSSTGRTLYLFVKDKGGKSSCFGACAGAWPPLLVTGKPVAGKGVAASKLTSVSRGSGMNQVVYNGHPLYLYVGDQSAGQTAGQGVPSFGAAWWVLSPAGSAITG